MQVPGRKAAALADARRPALFLSYSRKDGHAADRVLASLQEYAECWRDTQNILSGTPWREETLAAVTKQDVVVFLASPRSIDPERFCARELLAAQEHGKRIACLAIERVPKSSLPKELKFLEDQQWTSIDDPDWERRLRADVDADFDWVRLHTSIARAHYDYEDRHVNGHLLRGAQLKRAMRALAVTRTEPPLLTPEQRRYIARSRRASVARRSVLVVSSVALIVAATVTGMRLYDNHRSNAANELASAACAELGQDFGGSMVKAVAAAREVETPRTRSCLLTVLQAQPQVTGLLPALNNASAMAVDPTGRRLAAGGHIENGGRTLMIWDLQSRAVLTPPTVVAPEARSIAAAAFSPDGARLAVADSSATIHLYDVTGDALVEVLPTARVTTERMMVGQLTPTLNYTPQGDLIVAGADVTSGFVDVYPAGDLARRHTLVVPGLFHVGVGGDQILLGGGAGIFLLTHSELLNLTDLTRRKPDVAGNARAAVLSPDGRRLAWADSEGVVRTLDKLKPADGYFYGTAVERLAFTRDGSSLAIGDADTIHVVKPGNSDTDAIVLQLPGARALVFALGDVLVGGGDDIVLWDLHRTSRVLGEIPLPDGDTGGPWALAADGSLAAYKTTSGLLRVTNQRGQVTGQTQTPAGLTGLAILDDHHVLIVEGESATVWDTVTGDKRPKLLDVGQQTCDGSSSPSSSIAAVAVVDPTHVVATYGACGLVMRWDLSNGTGTRVPLPAGFRPDAVAAEGPSGAIAVGDAGVRDTTGQITALPPGAKKHVVIPVSRPSALAFGAEGTLLAAGGNSGGSQSTVSVIDLGDPQNVYSEPLSQTEVSAVAISPDDTTLVAADGGGTIKIWTMTASGLIPLSTVTVGNEPIRAAAFTASGTQLQILTPTRLLDLPLQTQDWLARACDVVSPLLDNDLKDASAERRDLRRSHPDVCRRR